VIVLIFFSGIWKKGKILEYYESNLNICKREEIRKFRMLHQKLLRTLLTLPNKYLLLEKSKKIVITSLINSLNIFVNFKSFSLNFSTFVKSVKSTSNIILLLCSLRKKYFCSKKIVCICYDCLSIVIWEYRKTDIPSHFREDS